jgi:hypothetical protein
VDTGADVVFKVTRSNGDITSITYQGRQLMAPYSLTHRNSHYEEGLSSTTTTVSTRVDLAGGTALVTAADRGSLGVTQYYAVRRGDNVIYMATYAGGASPQPRRDAVHLLPGPVQVLRRRRQRHPGPDRHRGERRLRRLLDRLHLLEVLLLPAEHRRPLPRRVRTRRRGLHDDRLA